MCRDWEANRQHPGADLHAQPTEPHRGAGGAGTSYFRFNSKLLNFSVNVKKYYYKHILSSVKVGKMFLILMFYLKSKHII